MLVYNSSDELFVQQRSALKDNSPGLWDTSAAGHVDSGETYDAAAVRELNEELGLGGITLEHLFDLDPTLACGNEFVRVYRCASDAPLTLAPDEIAAGRWITQTGLDDWVESDPTVFPNTFLSIQAQLKK